MDQQQVDPLPLHFPVHMAQAGPKLVGGKGLSIPSHLYPDVSFSALILYFRIVDVKLNSSYIMGKWLTSMALLRRTPFERLR